MSRNAGGVSKSTQSHTKGRNDRSPQNRNRNGISHGPQENHQRPVEKHYDDDMMENHDACYPRDFKMQMQQQTQHQRSADASIQMVYDVYGNLIGILEELEHRELEKSGMYKNMQRSDIFVPDQKHKNDKDITSIVETQLLLFETQLRYCRADIREQVTQNLTELTLQWSGERHTHEVPSGQKTDKYLAQVFEILSLGNTQHLNRYERPGDVVGVTVSDMQEVVSAQARIGHLDSQFNDPSRKALPPGIRQGDQLKGAERLRGIAPHLEGYIPHRYTEPMDMK